MRGALNQLLSIFKFEDPLNGRDYEKERQARLEERFRDTEEGLCEWLRVLELPQFEDEARLRAAARQLRIVLSHRLLRMWR
jgi:hypothetical protein